MKIIMLSLLVFCTPLAMASETSDHSRQYKHGSKVHNNHCMKCHTDSLYTRENRIVKSLNALGRQVRICRDNTDAPWFDADTDAVVEFLNKKYYKF